jgi:hypothetical protein
MFDRGTRMLRVGVSLLILCLSAPGESPSRPDFRITPSRATMIVGEEREFELNGPDGRPISGATWEMRGAAVDLLSQVPPTVAARQGGTATITATLEGRRAEAYITVIADSKLPAGTVRWSVEPMPGMKVSKTVQALHVSDATPDFYVNESGPSGALVRAIRADGREMWRWGGDPQKMPKEPESVAPAWAKPPVTAECREVKTNMSKDQVRKIFGDKLTLTADQYKETRWRIERQPMTCVIDFDATSGLVTRRKFAATEPE